MPIVIPKTMQITVEMMKMKEAIKRLPQYSLVRRWKMKRKLSELQSLAISVGIGLAVNDLVKAGIFKRV